MSIQSPTYSFVNPEPITVKGIKTYNPKLLKVYTDKSGEEYKFDAVEEKTTGTALGTIYKKQHQLDTEKKWMGKVGLPRGVFRDDPEKRINRSQEELNLDAIFEKLAYDLFQELGRGLFEVPKTHLSHQPIANNFSQDNIMVEAWSDLGIHESLRIMSYYLKGYEDFKNAQTLDGDEPIEFMKYLEKYKRPPEKLFTPEGRLVPLNGLMGLLAVGRCLCDTDLLGGNGENAGFQWIRNEEKEIVGARAVKIDPGLAFKFTNDSVGDEPCENWVLNTYHKLGESNHLGDLKDLQTSTSNFETRILWDALSQFQQKEFVAALLNTSRYVNSDNELRLLFFREKKFFYSEKAYMPEEIATKFQEQMKGWIHWQLEIYQEPLKMFLERYPEQLLRIRYIDEYGQLPLPLSKRTLPVCELFSNLTIIHPEKNPLENVFLGFNYFKCLKNGVEEIKLGDLFCDGENKIVMTGESGTGKSTMCQKIAHDWASGKLFSDKFHAVFWIPLRKLNDQDLAGSIHATLASYIGDVILRKEVSQSCLLRLIKSDKALFLLDGFDEATEALKESLSPLFEDEHCHLLLTSRIITDGIPNWKHIRNIGFSSRDIELYIEQFFEEKHPKFLNSLRKNAALAALAQNPFHLQMLCQLEKDGKRVNSLVELYHKMIEEVLKWEANRCDCSPDENSLLILGEASLLASVNKSAPLDVFLDRVLKKSSYGLEASTQFGFMMENEFLHPSMREFLIAYYLSRAIDLELKIILQWLLDRDPWMWLVDEDPGKWCENNKSSTISQALFGDWNPLHSAVKMGNMEAMKWLVEKDPNLLFHEPCEKMGLCQYVTPLHIAAENGHIDAMEWLYKKNWSQIFPWAKNNPMHAAAKNGQVAAMEWLHSKNPNFITLRGPGGGTLFHTAAKHNQVYAMAWLIGVVPFLLKKLNRRSETAFDLAKKHNHLQSIEFLKIVLSSIWRAVAKGELKKLKLFKADFPSIIKITNQFGRTLLHTAAEKGKLKIMYWLNKENPKLIKQVTKGGWTCFHAAAWGDQVEAMEWLYETRPELLQKATSGGWTPYDIADTQGSAKVIQWFYEKNLFSV